jgi:hypothetical protein
MAKRTDAGDGQTATPTLDPSHELPGATGAFQEAKEQAKTLAGDAKEQAKDMAGQARDHVQTLVGRQKDQAADRLHSLADVLREAGHKLDEGRQAGDFGQYADRAAQQVEKLSSYLRDHELKDFVRDTETFARRRPEVFLGGTLVAGLMLARFLKASRPNQERSGYDGGAWTGYPQSANRSSYTPQPRTPDVASAGTTPYNAPMGV